MNECCENCKFADGLQNACRRYPPTVYAVPWEGMDVPNTYPLYPPVQETDWCGEYQPKESPDE